MNSRICRYGPSQKEIPRGISFGSIYSSPSSGMTTFDKTKSPAVTSGTKVGSSLGLPPVAAFGESCAVQPASGRVPPGDRGTAGPITKRTCCSMRLQPRKRRPRSCPWRRVNEEQRVSVCEGSALALPGFTALSSEWRSGAATADPAIPASDSVLKSHPCVALSSPPVTAS